VVNVVNQPAYGLLIVNVQKLKSIDYKFPVEFSQLYYIQDLIEHCYQNKLWISNNKFIDMFESWKTVKSLRKATFSANMEKFNAEAEEYGKKQINYQSAQEFIDKFKEVYAK
jgi:thiamine pyrophosphate-dependent acetolactate synthase large subunit-like protein